MEFDSDSDGDERTLHHKSNHEPNTVETPGVNMPTSQISSCVRPLIVELVEFDMDTLASESWVRTDTRSGW